MQTNKFRFIFENMPHYIRTWKLNDSQSIHITNSKKVVFRHLITNSGGKHRGVCISLDALPSLKDFADLIDNHKTRMKIPLDQKVWIKCDSTVKLYVCSPKREDIDYRFFRFSDVTWRNFTKEILPHMISFIKDGGHQADGSRESHVNYKSKLKTQSSRNRAEHSQSKAMVINKTQDEADNESTSGKTLNVNMEDTEEG